MQDIIKSVKERRMKIVPIFSDQLLDYFQPCRTGYITMPVLVDIPKDAFVYRVYYDDEMDAFCFLLVHESFDKAEVGYRAPFANVEVKLVEVMMKYDRPERLDNPDSTGFIPDYRRPVVDFESQVEIEEDPNDI